MECSSYPSSACSYSVSFPDILGLNIEGAGITCTFYIAHFHRVNYSILVLPSACFFFDYHEYTLFIDVSISISWFSCTVFANIM